nr:MAG TPA: hypothetical protein [Caudoviricetes sp.]
MAKWDGGIVSVSTILTKAGEVHQIGESQAVRRSITTVERCMISHKQKHGYSNEGAFYV